MNVAEQTADNGERTRSIESHLEFCSSPSSSRLVRQQRFQGRRIRKSSSPPSCCCNLYESSPILRSADLSWQRIGIQKSCQNVRNSYRINWTRPGTSIRSISSYRVPERDHEEEKKRRRWTGRVGLGPSTSFATTRFVLWPHPLLFSSRLP